MSSIIRKLLLLTIAILLFKPFEGMSQYVYSDAHLQKQLNEARNDVYNEKFSDAVTKYSVLVKSNDNKTVSAEYAYVLALTGCYDGAIMNLDKIFASGQVDKDVLFYTSQVLKLMEYDSIADLFWKYGIVNKSYPPCWISGQYLSFVEKYHYPATINTDDLGTALQRANKLADHRQYIQSMVLFLELIETYPDQYLPCIGLSALLENLGFKKTAIDYLQKGIEKMGSKEDKFKIDPFGTYDKHLQELKTSDNADKVSLQAEKPETTNSKKYKSFSYYGLSYINKTLALNWKYGIYWKDNSFFTFGFSYYNYNNTGTYSVDIASNGKFWNVCFAGINLSAQWSSDSFSFGIGPCFGLSIPISGGKSSFDLMGGINVYLPAEISSTSYSSIGFTHYF